jgi:phage shock protein PspC (stress-responsive transcriptional regulator)
MTTGEKAMSEKNIRRLTRSRTERMIGGVCGGLGAYLEIDPTLVRLLFVLGLLFWRPWAAALPGAAACHAD